MRIGRLLAVASMLLMALVPIQPTWAQTAPPDPAAVATVLEAYRLGPGDKVRVTVFGEPTLSGEFQVSSSGEVSLPLIGDQQAQGLTVNELQRGIHDALAAGYLKTPRVSAEVLNYRPFFILGEVERPGQYPYTAGLTVLNAVATAGGFTYRANKGKVWVKHSGQGQERSYALEATLPVQPGDTIRIGERFF